MFVVSGSDAISFRTTFLSTSSMTAASDNEGAP
jgi:hypothetical protein